MQSLPSEYSNMDLLFKIILAIHIGGGTASLLAGLVALIVRKGRNTHRLAGKIFFWGMTIVFITAIYMSIAHNIPFLFMVGFFGYQLVLSGYRALHYKKLFRGQPVKPLDWAIIITAGIVDAAMIGWGIIQVYVFNNSFGIVAIVFGITGLSFVFRDYYHFKKGSLDKNTWLYKHISGMIGGYIAAITAFSVVNFSNDVPVLLVWLAPTALGTPLIIGFTISYKKKFSKGKMNAQLLLSKNAT
jgi:hypothetical protein